MAPPRELRRTIRLGVTVLLVLAVVAIAAAAVAFLRVLDARDDLNRSINPAQVQLETHLTSLVDQETALRAYLVTDDQTYLDTFEQGLATSESSSARLRDLLQGPDLEHLDEIDEAVAAWRAVFVDPVVAGEADQRRVVLADGKEAFDEIRAATDDLRRALVVEDLAAREKLDDATIQLVGTLLLVAVVLIAGGVGGWTLYRRSVEDPLLALGADAGRVAAGELAHPIAEVGPAEVEELARTMEAMRVRIIDEVTRVEEARAALQDQADDLARSNAELEQFAYVASHDLQEPLRKVASFCQLLEQRYGDQLDDRAHQYIGFAVDGAKRMQVLINDLLAFSRVGRLGGELGPVDLDAALDRALDNLSTVVEETGADIRRSPLPQVRGDLSLLAALFQNLVGNALKFRREGSSPEVDITAEVRDDEVEVLVHDDGIGIDPEHAERVFVIFQRLHGRDAYEGTGIGLALCRKIVEHHGGRIDVDTAEVAGTTIRFTLPLAVGAAHDPQGAVA